MHGFLVFVRIQFEKLQIVFFCVESSLHACSKETPVFVQSVEALTDMSGGKSAVEGNHFLLCWWETASAIFWGKSGTRGRKV